MESYCVLLSPSYSLSFDFDFLPFLDLEDFLLLPESTLQAARRSCKVEGGEIIGMFNKIQI